MRCTGPSSPVQDPRQPICGRAGASEDLPVAEADRPASLNSGIQVSVQVSITLSGGVVEEPAVELDHACLVHDVPIDHAQRRHGPPLSFSRREAMRSLDQSEKAVLEHRARARRNVVEHTGEPGAPRTALATCQAGAHPSCSRPPRLNGRGQDSKSRHIVLSGDGDIESRLLVSNARWRPVPHGSLLEMGHPMNLDAGGPGDAAIPTHGHVDDLLLVLARTVRDPERGLVAQHGGIGEENGCPRSLEPGELSGVVHVHPGVHGHQRASPQRATQVVLGQPGTERLTPGDHACLVAENACVVHGARMGWPPVSRQTDLHSCGRRVGGV